MSVVERSPRPPSAPSSQAEGQRVPRDTYFSILPADILPRVLSFLDEHSCRVMYLYRDSPFQEASADFFTSVEILDFSSIDVNFDVKLKTISIGTFARDEVLFQVFQVYGRVFQEVKFSAKKNSHRAYYAALMHCSYDHLRGIDLRIPEKAVEVMNVLRSILDKFGSQLERLSLYGEVIPYNRVAAFVGSLRKCTNLRSLSIRCNWEALAAGFWEQIGTNLEYVHSQLSRV